MRGTQEGRGRLLLKGFTDRLLCSSTLLATPALGEGGSAENANGPSARFCLSMGGGNEQSRSPKQATYLQMYLSRL